MKMEKHLTPDQMQEALIGRNLKKVSKESGAGYTSCIKVAEHGGSVLYRRGTTELISRYLLAEYTNLSRIYGLN